MQKKRKIWKLTALFLMSILLVLSNSIYMPVTVHADEGNERNAAVQEIEPETNVEPDSETTDESAKLIEDSEETDSNQTTDTYVENEQLSIDGICYILNENDISIGAACTTNASGVTYRWLSYNLDTREWKVISDWSGSNWSGWKPEKGNYWLQVQVQTAGGLTAEHTICFGVQKDYSTEQISLDGFCYIFQKDRIDIGTAYTSNCTNVEFKWMAYNLDSKVWSDISGWSTGNWSSWKPEKGNYWVVVQARTPGGKTVQNVLSFSVGRNYGKELSLNGICYIFRNNQIDVGVAYDCTDPKVEFQWMAYNVDTKKWSSISGWYAGNWSSWKPEKGNYWLQVQARMSDGTVKSKTICFHVDRDYQFEVRNILPVKYNDRIVLNAQYINGNKPVVFKWMIYDKSQSEWETLADWTAQESVVWNPKAGDYKISLQAADRDGNLKTYTIDYQVAADYSVAQTEAALLSVGQGKEFATINDAIKRAIEMGVSNANPVRIFIGAGYYNEQIVLDDVHGLTFEGEDRTNTTIEYAGGYPDCVIHVAGDITFSNLTMCQKGSTYTVHVDPVNTGVQGSVCYGQAFL